MSQEAADLSTASALNLSALCCDEELIGYDRNSGLTWIYPTNYSMRDYQFNIVNSALFKNTLVSLPTGLGKTFIAAVVMYNFYRWYPMGKIIFVAPTRPLVAQQIEACYKIMAIPQSDTIEMTGTTQTAARKIAWKQKRVFFATPQVVQNDLESGACPGELVRCLVIDEAHKAKGRHSYCQIIESLTLRKHTLFRVLALSATPGSKVDDVINVVRNLKIAHLELRTEECIDVAMYSYSRKIQTIVIELGDELTSIRQKFIDILDIYTRRLVQYKVLTGNIGSLSKGRIIMLFKEYQCKEKSLRHPQHKYIMLDFTMVITLYHALELLTKHGARVFLNFFDEHTDKAWIGKDDRITNFLETLRHNLGTNPLSIDRNTLPDGTIPMIKEDLKYGHPKFDHLKTIITEHFNKAKFKGKETKAIVFCEYRESVNLVHCLLLQCRPLIRPHMFVGQGLGSNKDNAMKPFSQKQQLRVMQSFREGTCNVLVSTCVGEEGLDVGNVDLIICFDISNKSPVRLVQRCGRTGRERGGHVVILVTEGREHQTLRECIYQRDNLNKRILQSKELHDNLYTASPRLLPANVKPECQKMFITVEKIDNTKPTKQSKIKDVLKRKSKAIADKESSSQITKEEFAEIFKNKVSISNYLPQSEYMWNMTISEFEDTVDVFEDEIPKNDKVDLSRWLEFQRNLQYTAEIGHSSDSKMLSELLQYADSIRFGLPIDDGIVPDIPEKITSKVATNKTKDKKVKNFDIRDMFCKIKKAHNKEESAFRSKMNEILNDCGIVNTDTKHVDAILERENISPILVDLMVEMNIDRSNEIVCETDSFLNNLDSLIRKIDLNGPDLNEINVRNLPDINLISLLDFDMIDHLDNDVVLKSFDSNIINLNQSIEKIDDDAFNEDCSFASKFSTHGDFFAMENNKNNPANHENFDGINIDDIFNDCDFSPDSPKIKSVEDNPKIEFAKDTNKVSDTKNESKNPLDFFGLGDIDDIFADDSFDGELNDCPKSDDKNNADQNVAIVCDDKKMTQDNNLSSFLSVSQIIGIVNEAETKQIDSDDPVTQESQVDTNTRIITLDELLNMEDSDDSNRSIILCSQKPKMIKKPVSSKKQKIIIPASPESSDSFDNDEIENLMNLCDNENRPDSSKRCDDDQSKTANKRKLSSPEWDLECSPFFAKSQKLNNEPFGNYNSEKKTLKDKLYSSANLNSAKREPSYDRLCKENLHPEEYDKSIVANNSFNTNENKIVNQLKIFKRDTFSQKLQKIKSKSNESVLLFSSDEGDDDFIQKPFTKNNSFCISPVKNAVPDKKSKKKIKKPVCEFIDYEAVLSGDSCEDSGDECNDDSDTTMGSFICDEQNIETDDSTDIKSKYLQSIKSPARIAGAFKIPELPKRDENVFSQIEPDADVSYELDSFCVGADEGLTQQHDLSELEIAEAILKDRKRRRKAKSPPTSNENRIESDSDDSPIVQNKKKRARMRIESDSGTDDDDLQAFVI